MFFYLVKFLYLSGKNETGCQLNNESEQAFVNM